jgi:uncharacterized protein
MTYFSIFRACFPMKRIRYAALIAACIYAPIAMGAERTALVVGQGAYPAGSRLPTAITEAEMIASTLEQLGFETKLITDVSKSKLVDELEEFSGRVAGAEVAVLFYAGHGISLGEKNYLLPTDFTLTSDMSLGSAAISLDDAIASLNGAKFRLAFVDMAAKNPYVDAVGLNFGSGNTSISDRFSPFTTEDANTYLSQANALIDQGEELSPYATKIIEAFAAPGADFKSSLVKLGEDLAAAGIAKPLEFGAVADGLVLTKADDEMLLSAARAAEARASESPADECDRLAANPNDPMKSPLYGGIEFEQHISEDALKACQTAVQRDPGNARLQYQTGRVLKALSRFTEARPYLEKAQSLGSLAARVAMSQFLHDGLGEIKADKKKARSEFLDQAGEGSTDALVILGSISDNSGAYDKAVSFYRKAYEKGNATGAFGIGVLYQAGLGVKEDQAQAIAWFKRAADKNTGAALDSMGDIFNYEEEVLNKPLALHMYLKAAEFGSRKRYAAIAKLYAENTGGVQNFTEAKKWYLRAGAEGKYQIGELHYFGRGTSVDYAEALSWYRKAAEEGHGGAMRDIAIMYEAGRGVQEDAKASFEWNIRAAEKGNTNAMNDLGYAYLNGTVVAKDLSEAKKWYSRAADTGDSLAMNQLGWIYQISDPPNYDRAMEWYRKGSAADNARATRNVGWLYKNGKGVPKSEKEALTWFRKAAEAGDELAMNELGAAYGNGVVVARDYKEAGRWYEKAAAAGNDYANLNLASLFSRGHGCKQDPELAAQLAEMAVRGDVWARDNLKTGWSSWNSAFLVAFQRRLSQLELYDGAADGRFGKRTLAAIDALHDLGKQ